MKKLTKSLVTALSLATATLSVIPQAAAPAQAATKAKSKTGTEYKDGRYITVMHSSAVYSKNLKKTTSSVAEGKKILTFGRTTIKNKKYYQTGYNSFISASNVDGTTRTLKKNAYVYKKSKGKAVRYKNSVLKQNSQQQTYGSAVSIKGKKYYIIGVGKYVAKSDFK